MENTIKKIIKELYELDDIEVELSQVPDGMNGDIACNVAMRLAARLKKNPRQIAEEIVDKLKELGIRVALNASDEKLSYRMREEQIKKIPIMLVLGNNERDERTVTLRLHGDEQKNMTLDEFLTYVKEKNDSKALDL